MFNPFLFNDQFGGPGFLAWQGQTPVGVGLDQEVLAKVANTSDDWCVRLAAVDIITDQVALVEVVKTNSDWYVRLVALEKLTDQAMLAEVAKTNSDWYVRLAAVEELTDKRVLAEVARTDSDSKVRWLAVYMLTDQVLLSEVARTDSDGKVRLAAVEQLTDQAMLADVARTNSDREVRLAATQKLEIKKVHTKAHTKEPSLNSNNELNLMANIASLIDRRVDITPEKRSSLLGGLIRHVRTMQELMGHQSLLAEVVKMNKNERTGQSVGGEVGSPDEPPNSGTP